MTEYEIKQIQEYLNKKFSSNKFVAKKRKSIDDSCEIFLDDEFIGLVYVEDDEGEISYQFHMTILKEDLLNSRNETCFFSHFFLFFFYRGPS